MQLGAILAGQRTDLEALDSLCEAQDVKLDALRDTALDQGEVLDHLMSAMEAAGKTIGNQQSTIDELHRMVNALDGRLADQRRYVDVRVEEITIRLDNLLDAVEDLQPKEIAPEAKD